MTYTDYFPEVTGLNLYAKPIPIIESPWIGDEINLSEDSTALYTASGLEDGTDYAVYIRSGGTPASSDNRTGFIYYRSGTGITSLETTVNNLQSTVNTLNSSVNTQLLKKLRQSLNRNVEIYTGDTSEYTLPTTIDLSATTIVLIVETKAKVEIDRITSFTEKNQNDIRFNIPSSLSSSAASYRYTIRRSSDSRVMQRGTWIVRYDPSI